MSDTTAPPQSALSPPTTQPAPVPADLTLSDHVKVLKINVQILSAKMADQKDDVETSLELWGILKELEEQIKASGGAQFNGHLEGTTVSPTNFLPLSAPLKFTTAVIPTQIYYYCHISLKFPTAVILHS